MPEEARDTANYSDSEDNPTCGSVRLVEHYIIIKFMFIGEFYRFNKIVSVILTPKAIEQVIHSKYSG